MRAAALCVCVLVCVCMCVSCCVHSVGLFCDVQVKETNSLTGKARRLLTGMKRRACTNRLMLWGIIIILLGLIGVVLYFGIKKF